MGPQFVSRVENLGENAAPFVRRVALAPGFPDSTPRSIQYLSRQGNRFTVLGNQDDVSFEDGTSSGVVQTTVLAVSAHVKVAHKFEARAMDDGDTDSFVSEDAGRGSEAGSDTETEGSHTKSVQSIIGREKEDTAVPPVVEEVPEAKMTLGIKEGLANLDTV